MLRGYCSRQTMIAIESKQEKEEEEKGREWRRRRKMEEEGVRRRKRGRRLRWSRREKERKSLKLCMYNIHCICLSIYM